MSNSLPSLPWSDWSPTRASIHPLLKLMEHVRFHLSPPRNHWWHITLYPVPEGFTTGPVPSSAAGALPFSITLHMPESCFIVTDFRGDATRLPIENGMAFGHVWERLLRALPTEGALVSASDNRAAFEKGPDVSGEVAWDAGHAEAFRRIMLWVAGVLDVFSGRSYAKTSPVHLFPHHMDMALTRFSGRRLKELSEAEGAGVEYEHEIVSFGFWMGDDNVPDPSFYGYAWPSPEGAEGGALSPDAARWDTSGPRPMALLSWEDVRLSGDPRQAALDFLDSTFRAVATGPGWDLDALHVPPVSAW